MLGQMRLIRFFPAGVLLMASLAAAQPLRVMSFNVRYPAKSDGPNVWELRRDLLLAAIRNKQPDVIGTQELFYLQGEYIVEKMPEYAWFGVSRRGDRTDEHMGVFYKKSRFDLIASGNFWLSETPDKPASMAWNIDLPRMVTWGQFRDKAAGREFRLFNTHFPHRRTDEEARTQCARLIAERIKTLASADTVVVTGDFNIGLESDAHRILSEPLTDAWRSVSKPLGPVGTFHGFTGTPGEARIDWILYRGDLRPVSVETATFQENGRYPSDHFPVLAVFEWKR
jgi:endonuclease/exonuclease/phosphatase family metal-dependent hydrolase